jgi:hypothetical protein
MGNRALRRYVDSLAVRRLYLGNKPQWDTATTVPKAKVGPLEVGKGKRGTDLQAIDTALAAYGTAGGGATRPQQLNALKAAITTWINGKAGQSSQRRPTVVDLEQEVDDKITYFGRDAMKYRNPPLTEGDARALIVRIENGDRTAINGLLGKATKYGPTKDFEAPWEHEWGLGVDLVTDEAYLIPGDATGVTWTVHNPYVRQVAHSHPYFTDPGEPGGRDRRNAVGVRTKEIADHNGQQGIVRWADLVSGAENREMLKIFPSGSDVDFAAKRHVSPHTVYTTYRVDDQGTEVGNPTSALAGGPQLSFEIVNAAMTGNPNISICTMHALADGAIFWTGNARGDMANGGAGILEL